MYTSRITFNQMAAILSFVLISGCATIFSGTSQQIRVDSNIEGAEVYLNGQKIGETPLVTKIPREINAHLEVRSPGHVKQQLPLKTVGTIGLYAGYIMMSVTVGTTSVLIDYGTGAAYEYQPGRYYFDLEKSDISETEKKQSQVEQRLRAFLITQYDSLLQDLSIGSGEYLDAAYFLMKLRTLSEKHKALTEMRRLMHRTPPKFANQVLLLKLSDSCS